MRTISATAQALLDSKRKIEPIICIDVQWTIGGKWYQYAEKQLVNGSGRVVKGIINQVDGLDNVIIIQSVMTGTSGDSQSLSLTLDDTSGELKDIIMGNDVHKRTVKVYLYLDGTDFDADRIWLFTGELSTPIEWSEGTRTVVINIINKIEDAEVGFSIEEGDFYLPPQELIGVAWPLVFGKCINIPALRVKDPVRGILKTGFGVADFVLPHLAKQIQAVCCPLEFAGFATRFRGEHWLPSLEIYATYSVNASCYCKKEADIAAALEAYNLQKQYEYDELEIAGGKQFPQGRRIWIKADEAKIYGYFSGNTFHALRYVHPKFDEIEIPPYKYGWALCNDDNLMSDGNYRALPKPTFNTPRCDDQGNAATENTGWDYVAQYPRADFYWVQPGVEVYQIDSGGDSVHVVNILPSTVHRVAAWKTYDLGIRELAGIPKSYYTTRVSNFNGYQVTEVVLNKPLRFYDEGWEGDELYVSLTSSVGPNVVDEMIWLINKYTNLSYDSSNFNAVKSKLAVYRNNYPILERKNIIEVLRTMAFNNRCALILRDNEFKLIYLSEEPTSVMTITEDDIIPGTLKIGHTSTEDLVTKVNGVWRDDYAYDEKKYVSRYNVKKYGTMEDTFEFPCFNIYQWVVKSNTFWMIRMANTWKTLTFQTYMDKIGLEVLDCIEVNLPDFLSGTVKCIVENATYDSSNNLLEIQCWTPVRAGEDVPLDFAHPAAIRVDRYWPTADDIKAGFGGGSGPNVDVKAPTGHPLGGSGLKGFSGFQLEDDINKGPCDSTSTRFKPIGCRPDHGDTQPSDIDDKNTNVTTPGETDSGDNPDAKGGYGKMANFVSWQEAQEAAEQEAKSGPINTGSNTQTGEQDKPTNPDAGSEWCDDMPSPDDKGWDENDMPDCLVVVKVGYLRPVNRVFLKEGGTSGKVGDVGKAVNDQPDAARNANKYYFNSLEAAKSFKEQMRQMACGYDAVVGAIWPACDSITLDTQNDGTWTYGTHEGGTQSGASTGDCTEPEEPGMVAKDESKGGGSPRDIGGQTSTGLCDSLNPSGVSGGYNGSSAQFVSGGG